jgi:integration host factor subunit beta
VAKTKAELIDALAARTKLSQAQAESVVSQVFDCMADALQRGEAIQIRGFGSLSIRSYGAYDGRNPRSGTPVHVAAKRLPFFKVGKQLRARVHAGRFAAVARK